MTRRIDLAGRRFGKWIALEFAGTNGHRSAFWLCRCDCGTERCVLSSSLIQGDSTKCGLCNERNDLTGRRFGRLLVLSCNAMERGKDSRWLCQCDCGQEKIVSGGFLIIGKTQSCGCLRDERRTAAVIKQNTKHGASRRGRRIPEYQIWSQMIQRCTNPNNRSFLRWYGARGITVCDRWLRFENFLADMGHRPEGCSLDRIDPDGNYELSNCRWATDREQARNKRPLIAVEGIRS